MSRLENSHDYKTEGVTIANGETTSPAIFKGGSRLIAVRMPAGIDGSTLAIHGSTTEGGTFVPIQRENGAAVSMAITASTICGLETGSVAVAAVPWIKLVSDSAQTGDADLEISISE